MSTEREVSAEEFYAGRGGRIRYFLTVPPIPDDAIGVCSEGHAMRRDSGSADGWWHIEDGLHLRCATCQVRDRSVRVIGVKTEET